MVAKLIPPFPLSLAFSSPPLLLNGQKAQLEKGEKTARGEREGTHLPLLFFLDLQPDGNSYEKKQS